ncbi:MAG: hypothetical protein KatS3mg087_0779 [Patescibacteria group bacterium]|nr:MAG: hypothetical protein KatS3mg087_0779 [Patescibacteria group bacterium]
MDDKNQQSVYEETYMDVLESSIVRTPKPRNELVGSWVFVMMLLILVASVGFGVSFFITLYMS